MKLHTGLGPNPRTVRMFLAEKGWFERVATRPSTAV